MQPRRSHTNNYPVGMTGSRNRDNPMAHRSMALLQLGLLSYVSNTANSLGLPVLTSGYSHL
jgi:hypothetical protein